MITRRDAAEHGLETKFMAFGEESSVSNGRLSGYASVFDAPDQSGDVVAPGAFAASLAAGPRSVKLLWQHDPAQPIGVWETLREDGRGLFAEGRLLTEIRAGAEAAALLRAGAVDGLSIGYRARRSERLSGGGRRLLDIELWEISLVTFPMLSEARAAPLDASADPEAREVLAALRAARAAFA